MKNQRRILVSLVIGAFLFCAGNPQAAIDADKEAISSKNADYQKMLERGRAAEKDNIEVLSSLVGEWNYTATFWTKPDAEGMRSDGTTTNEMVLNDRFLASNVVGAFNIDGKATPIKGQGMIGYDSTKKAFTSVWADTLSPGMMIGKGIYDAKTKSIKETGQFINPLTGAQEGYSSELIFIDSKTYKKTLFTSGKTGKYTKLMEIEYSKS